MIQPKTYTMFALLAGIARTRWITRLTCIAAVLAATCQFVQAQDDTDLKWWKGNIHTHSLWSDGDDFPEMIADWYRSHGYHFLALSDHNILSEGSRWMKHDDIVARGGKDALAKYRQRFGEAWVETRGEPGTPEFEVRLKPLNEFRKLLEQPGKFIMIQGEEISDRAEGVPVHLNATNLTELLEPMGGRTVAETIDNNLRAVEEHAQRTGQEVLGHLNHPNFGWAITAEDMAVVLREKFFEVYNGHPVVRHLGDKHHPSVERLWDIANTIRIDQLGSPPLLGLGTDDSHDYHGQEGAHPGRGWIMVRAKDLEPETLIRAIKAGQFYASSGVTLTDFDYDADSGIHQLKIEAEPGVEYTTEFVGTLRGYDSTSQPTVDDEGKPIRATRIYSDEVGQVLATALGPTPSYRLTGDELYVRAVVTSSLPADDPAFEGQHQQAWTQPVGWESKVGRSSTDAPSE